MTNAINLVDRNHQLHTMDPTDPADSNNKLEAKDPIDCNDKLNATKSVYGNYTLEATKSVYSNYKLNSKEAQALLLKCQQKSSVVQKKLLALQEEVYPQKTLPFFCKLIYKIFPSDFWTSACAPEHFDIKLLRALRVALKDSNKRWITEELEKNPYFLTLDLMHYIALHAINALSFLFGNRVDKGMNMEQIICKNLGNFFPNEEEIHNLSSLIVQFMYLTKKTPVSALYLSNKMLVMRTNLEYYNFHTRKQFVDKLKERTANSTRLDNQYQTIQEMGDMVYAWLPDMWTNENFLKTIATIEKIHAAHIHKGPVYVYQQYLKLHTHQESACFYHIWFYAYHLLYGQTGETSIYDRFIEWHALELLAFSKETNIEVLLKDLKKMCSALLPIYPFNEAYGRSVLKNNLYKRKQPSFLHSEEKNSATHENTLPTIISTTPLGYKSATLTTSSFSACTTFPFSGVTQAQNILLNTNHPNAQQNASAASTSITSTTSSSTALIPIQIYLYENTLPTIISTTPLIYKSAFLTTPLISACTTFSFSVVTDAQNILLNTNHPNAQQNPSAASTSIISTASSSASLTPVQIYAALEEIPDLTVFTSEVQSSDQVVQILRRPLLTIKLSNNSKNAQTPKPDDDQLNNLTVFKLENSAMLEKLGLKWLKEINCDTILDAVPSLKKIINENYTTIIKNPSETTSLGEIYKALMAIKDFKSLTTDQDRYALAARALANIAFSLEEVSVPINEDDSQSEEKKSS